MPKVDEPNAPVGWEIIGVDNCIALRNVDLMHAGMGMVTKFNRVKSWFGGAKFFPSTLNTPDCLCTDVGAQWQILPNRHWIGFCWVCILSLDLVFASISPRPVQISLTNTNANNTMPTQMTTVALLNKKRRELTCTGSCREAFDVLWTLTRWTGLESIDTQSKFNRP